MSQREQSISQLYTDAYQDDEGDVVDSQNRIRDFRSIISSKKFIRGFASPQTDGGPVSSKSVAGTQTAIRNHNAAHTQAHETKLSNMHMRAELIKSMQQSQLHTYSENYFGNIPEGFVDEFRKKMEVQSILCTLLPMLYATRFSAIHFCEYMLHRALMETGCEFFNHEHQTLDRHIRECDGSYVHEDHAHFDNGMTRFKLLRFAVPTLSISASSAEEVKYTLTCVTHLLQEQPELTSLLCFRTFFFSR